MSGNDMTERELDEALARIAGRQLPPPSAADARAAARAAADEAWVAEEEATSATPWRAAVHWESREELAAAEAELAGLYVSRRGESPAGAQRHVERLLREAWWRPGTAEEWTPTGNRFRSVTNALANELDRLRTTPAIAAARRRPASTQEAIKVSPPAARRPAIIREHGHIRSIKGEER